MNLQFMFCCIFFVTEHELQINELLLNSSHTVTAGKEVCINYQNMVLHLMFDYIYFFSLIEHEVMNNELLLIYLKSPSHRL